MSENSVKVLTNHLAFVKSGMRIVPSNCSFGKHNPKHSFNVAAQPFTYIQAYGLQGFVISSTHNFPK